MEAFQLGLDKLEEPIPMPLCKRCSKKGINSRTFYSKAPYNNTTRTIINFCLSFTLNEYFIVDEHIYIVHPICANCAGFYDGVDEMPCSKVFEYTPVEQNSYEHYWKIGRNIHNRQVEEKNNKVSPKSFGNRLEEVNL